MEDSQRELLMQWIHVCQTLQDLEKAHDLIAKQIGVFDDKATTLRSQITHETLFEYRRDPELYV